MTDLSWINQDLGQMVCQAMGTTCTKSWRHEREWLVEELCLENRPSSSSAQSTSSSLCSLYSTLHTISESTWSDIFPPFPTFCLKLLTNFPGSMGSTTCRSYPRNSSPCTGGINLNHMKLSFLQTDCWQFHIQFNLMHSSLL